MVFGGTYLGAVPGVTADQLKYVVDVGFDFVGGGLTGVAMGLKRVVVDVMVGAL